MTSFLSLDYIILMLYVGFNVYKRPIFEEIITVNIYPMNCIPNPLPLQKKNFALFKISLNDSNDILFIKFQNTYVQLLSMGTNKFCWTSIWRNFEFDNPGAFAKKHCSDNFTISN